MEHDRLPERACELGETMLGRLREALAHRDGVREVRGRGLMIGIELDRPCGELVHRALEENLLINVTAERTIRLLPPMIISDEDARRIVDTVIALVDGFLAGKTESAND
ncbi:MAG: aminotransferase class III-fold pyridoxal phosphate-dependent enzyme, partial [Ectothiorhodospiraceae bacterium]|jgi:acetylornithine aminotransferase